jgi:rSAM/selenodomain-associated transferase 1
MTEAVIVFARLPQKGKVKTRLAKKLGEDFAVAFYKSCAGYILNECRNILSNNTAIYVFYPADNDVNFIKDWIGNDFRYLPQRGEDIGQKMNNAFKDVFSEGAEKVILIGTDIPGISSCIISDALNVLTENEVVIGPAEDGGYYLLGMKKQYDILFENIKWGTGSVLASTLDVLANNKIEFKLMPELIDIDTEESLNNWMNTKNGWENNPVRKFLNTYFDLNKSLK